MTVLLSTRENIVYFDNDYEYDYTSDNPEESVDIVPHYKVKITIQTLSHPNYKGIFINKTAEYFDLLFEYTFHPGQLSSPKEISIYERNMHPFYSPETKSISIHSKYSDVIYKNTLTNTMIEYLLMDDKKLVTFSGLEGPQNYRKNIMKSLGLFAMT